MRVLINIILLTIFSLLIIFILDVDFETLSFLQWCGLVGSLTALCILDTVFNDSNL